MNRVDGSSGYRWAGDDSPVNGQVPKADKKERAAAPTPAKSRGLSEKFKEVVTGKKKVEPPKKGPEVEFRQLLNIVRLFEAPENYAKKWEIAGQFAKVLFAKPLNHQLHLLGMKDENLDTLNKRIEKDGLPKCFFERAQLYWWNTQFAKGNKELSYREFVSKFRYKTTRNREIVERPKSEQQDLCSSRIGEGRECPTLGKVIEETGLSDLLTYDVLMAIVKKFEEAPSEALSEALSEAPSEALSKEALSERFAVLFFKRPLDLQLRLLNMEDDQGQTLENRIKDNLLVNYFTDKLKLFWSNTQFANGHRDYAYEIFNYVFYSTTDAKGELIDRPEAEQLKFCDYKILKGPTLVEVLRQTGFYEVIDANAPAPDEQN